jgi:hypothetical protein
MNRVAGKEKEKQRLHEHVEEVKTPAAINNRLPKEPEN